MNKADNGKQIDDDILQCKADILRASDIMPLYKEKIPQEPISQETGQNLTGSTDAAERSAEKEETTGREVQVPELEKIKQSEDTSLIQIEPAQSKQTRADKEKTTEAVKRYQEKTEIPRFDLAKEIMAKQRKITAIGRKAPDKKIEAQSQAQQAESIGYTIVEQPVLMPSEQEQIIAEIVARDIERLCGGDI